MAHRQNADRENASDATKPWRGKPGDSDMDTSVGVDFKSKPENGQVALHLQAGQDAQALQVRHRGDVVHGRFRNPQRSGFKRMEASHGCGVLTFAAIGTILGISKATVAETHDRAIAKLRPLLQDVASWNT